MKRTSIIGFASFHENNSIKNNLIKSLTKIDEEPSTVIGESIPEQLNDTDSDLFYQKRDVRINNKPVVIINIPNSSDVYHEFLRACDIVFWITTERESTKDDPEICQFQTVTNLCDNLVTVILFHEEEEFELIEDGLYPDVEKEFLIEKLYHVGLDNQISVQQIEDSIVFIAREIEKDSQKKLERLILDKLYYLDDKKSLTYDEKISLFSDIKVFLDCLKHKNEIKMIFSVLTGSESRTFLELCVFCRIQHIRVFQEMKIKRGHAHEGLNSAFLIGFEKIDSLKVFIESIKYHHLMAGVAQFLCRMYAEISEVVQNVSPENYHMIIAYTIDQGYMREYTLLEKPENEDEYTKKSYLERVKKLRHELYGNSDQHIAEFLIVRKINDKSFCLFKN